MSKVDPNMIINLYRDEFGDLPPQAIGISYSNDFYQELMADAIVRGAPITTEELDKALENIPHDIDYGNQTKKFNKFKGKK